MAKPVSNIDPEKLLGRFFRVDEGLPCPEGTNLLNSAFAGIPEWETFSQHYGFCELCNA